MKCLDCGNEAAFEHHIQGTETRVYDDGEYQSTAGSSIETTAITCVECGGQNVDD